MEQAVIIGAGPCGLSAALELRRKNIDPLIIEKGCIVNSVFHYPTNMHFFSTPELLEIGGYPFMTQHEKPTRQEALNYYRTVAARSGLRIRTYEEVRNVRPENGGFVLETLDRWGNLREVRAKKVIIATGYFDNPNELRVPGEQLDKVSHYFKEAHPYQGMKVAVIGGKNSAVEAAMELERVGAEVTVIYRRGQLTESVKPWVRPLFESLLNKGRIRMMWNSHVKEIRERSIIVDESGTIKELENDFVFALTGFHPNHQMLRAIGVEINEETGAPVFDPETMETNVKGVYVAGVISAGYEANVIFIENGRLHGKPIAEHIAAQIAVQEGSA
jgi:thioredoxin reductase (NADPH)